MENKGYKFYLEADIKNIEETNALKKEAASVIDLPNIKDKQPDLSYFSSIFVSTGTNLNNAHFLASEIVMADNTIPGKAVDIEHEEDQIIGHIYKHAFTDKAGNKLELSELQNKETASLDEQEMHVEIASVIYKTRFPEIAEEVKDGKWKVSMEAYYTSYDVKVGNTIMKPNEAEALGFDLANEEMYGKSAKIVKGDEVIDDGKIARVLRGICFSGVGIVKNPANPPSVVLETASDNGKEFIFNYDNLKEKVGNKVTSSNVEEKEVHKEESDAGDKNLPVTVGVCVNYHKEVNDSVVKDQDSKILHTNWCSKFDTSCTTSGDATQPECLIFKVTSALSTIVKEKFLKHKRDSKIERLTDKLLKVLKEN